jgi:hypothetical protein
MMWEENIYSSVQEISLEGVIFLPFQIVRLHHYQRAFPLHRLKLQALSELSTSQEIRKLPRESNSLTSCPHSHGATSTTRNLNAT